jgi:hypothetical protein
MIFLIVCLWKAYAALTAISQHNEISPPTLSRPIHGPHVLAHDFTAHVPILGKLYVFVDRERLPGLAQEILRVELVDATSRAVVQQHESSLSEATFLLGDALALTPGWALERGKRYTLRFSLPSTPENRGLSFVQSPVGESGSSHLLIDDAVQPGVLLNHLLLGPRPSFPLGLVVIGALLSGLCLARAPTAGHWPILFVVTGLAALLSEYVWEQALWGFWGEYWPDGYISMAHQIFRSLSGEGTLGEALDFVARERNGCNFLTSLLIALLHGLGLRYISAYATVSLGFSAATLAILATAARKWWALTPMQSSLLILVTGLHLLVVRGFFRPQTDAGGMFFAAMFVAAFTSAVRSPRRTPGSLLAAVAAISLGILTRVALSPLLLVPVVFATWPWRRTESAARDRGLVMKAVSTTLGAATLVAVTFTGLRLWESVAFAGRFAAREEFRALFSLEAFTRSAVLAGQLALPLGLFHLRKVLSDERLAIPLIGMLGLQGLLLIGQVVPWARYWAPVAPLSSAFACALLFDERPRLSGWQFLGLGALTAGNLLYVAVRLA